MQVLDRQQDLRKELGGLLLRVRPLDDPVEELAADSLRGREAVGGEGWVGGGGGGVRGGGGGAAAAAARRRQRWRAAAQLLTMYVFSLVATTSFSWTMCGWLSSRRILISVSSASRFSSSVRSPFSTTLIA